MAQKRRKVTSAVDLQLREELREQPGDFELVEREPSWERLQAFRAFQRGKGKRPPGVVTRKRPLTIYSLRPPTSEEVNAGMAQTMDDYVIGGVAANARSVSDLKTFYSDIEQLSDGQIRNMQQIEGAARLKNFDFLAVSENGVFGLASKTRNVVEREKIDEAFGLVGSAAKTIREEDVLLYLRLGARTFAVDSVHVFMLGEENKVQRLRLNNEGDAINEDAGFTTRAKNAIARVINEGNVIGIRKLAETDQRVSELIEGQSSTPSFNAESCVILPMRANLPGGVKTIGAVVLDNRISRRPLMHEHAEQHDIVVGDENFPRFVTRELNTLADVVATRLEMEKLSVIDPISGVFNRRYLVQRLPEELRRIATTGEPIAVGFPDIDQFKGFVEEEEHQGASAAVQTIAGRFQKVASERHPGSFVVGYAGDELVVVLLGAGDKEAFETFKTMQEEIGRIRHREKKLTVSLGYTICDADRLAEELPENGEKALALVAERRLEDAALGNEWAKKSGDIMIISPEAALGVALVGEAIHATSVAKSLNKTLGTSSTVINAQSAPFLTLIAGASNGFDTLIKTFETACKSEVTGEIAEQLRAVKKT